MNAGPGRLAHSPLLLALIVVHALPGTGFSADVPLSAPAPAAVPGAASEVGPKWTRGPFADSNEFPIAVWLQHPRNARRYQAAGINLYVGLWRGPTAEQLSLLREAGMPVICAQNRVGLEHRDDPIIVGWMHDDEPDNAQSLGEGRGWGPPIPPASIVRDYERMREADPSRPVLLNLGQGVAWDDYIGRGVRRRHPEDYPEYVRGADIVSFDIYPVVHDSPAIAGRLEVVPYGVERLLRWAGDRRRVWNCIECTHISNPDRKATPAQVRAQVWMSLIHGSRGIIYFVHQFKPEFREAALLDDPVMLSAITTLNRQIRSLAPVLNSPTLLDAVTVRSSSDDTPVAVMVKHHGGATHLFSVNLRNRPTRATFTFRAPPPAGAVARLLDGPRSVPIDGGRLTDEFGPYEARLYEIR